MSSRLFSKNFPGSHGVDFDLLPQCIERGKLHFGTKAVFQKTPRGSAHTGLRKSRTNELPAGVFPLRPSGGRRDWRPRPMTCPPASATRTAHTPSGGSCTSPVAMLAVGNPRVRPSCSPRTTGPLTENGRPSIPAASSRLPSWIAWRMRVLLIRSPSNITGGTASRRKSAFFRLASEQCHIAAAVVAETPILTHRNRPHRCGSQARKEFRCLHHGQIDIKMQRNEQPDAQTADNSRLVVQRFQQRCGGFFRRDHPDRMRIKGQQSGQATLTGQPRPPPAGSPPDGRHARRRILPAPNAGVAQSS